MTDYRIHRVLIEKLNEAIYHGLLLHQISCNSCSSVRGMCSVLLPLQLRYGDISFHFAKFCHPDIPARSASLSTLPCRCPEGWRMTSCVKKMFHHQTVALWRSKHTTHPTPRSKPQLRQQVTCAKTSVISITRSPGSSSWMEPTFHNHPSGNPAPSASDMNETNKLKKACDIFDISLLDHIILSDNSYYSFAEETQNKF